MWDTPVVTWNLLLCGLGFPYLLYVIKSGHKRDAEITERDRREIRQSLACIQGDLKVKADKGELKEAAKELWDRMYDHEHAINCDSRECTAKKTGGVIISHGGPLR